jgi:hypothetical protein
MRAAVVVSVLVGLTAACSRASGPGVAQLSSSSTAHTSKTGVIAFAQCMRRHGIANFPDSGQLQAGSGVDPDSAQFRRAASACRSLLPQGGGGQISTKDQQAFLAFSACMRSHGVPNFPDPDFSGGGATISIGGGGLDPSSPRFQAASTSCKHLLPGGGPRGGARRQPVGHVGAAAAGG